MAETVVSFLLNELSTLLRVEGRLFGGLRQDFQDIKAELDHMRAFLRVAEAKEEEDPRLQQWIQEVREAAYDTEDILDEFILQFANNRSNGFMGSVKGIFSLAKNLCARHQIASEIQDIKKSIAGIFERHQRYQSEYGIIEQVSGSVALLSRIRQVNASDALLVEEAKLVGIHGPKNVLISQLLDEYARLKVVSVVGMGGLGKTTLVKRVYEDENVRSKFPVRAWITQTRREIDELLNDLIKQLYDGINKPAPPDIKYMATERLVMCLKEFLEDKRYVIVFDDVWDINFWNNIKFALPEGDFGNRVMVTTRNVAVASATRIETHAYIHKMKALPFEDSWTLFCRRTFEDQSCPAHLKDVCESILGRCEGLPLGIVAVSGFLALKDKNDLTEWEKVRRSIGTEMEGSGKLDRIKKILSVSYNELPYYLKTCLLYLSIFPESNRTLCRQLLRFWISEGFIQEKVGMTVEEVAEDYLKELINRSLVQVIDTQEEGRPLTCRIHDLLREILLSKSRELNINIMTVATSQNTRWAEKVRRLVIYSCSDSMLEDKSFEHLRSLITFASTESLSKSSISKILCGGCRWLKILDLRNTQLEEIPNEVFNLFHLKHLCFRGTRVKKVPKAIRNLKKLEYLDLCHTEVRELPKEILKLRKLSDLLLYKGGAFTDDFIDYGFDAPYEIGELLSLQYLFCINLDDNGTVVREIGKLTSLKLLGIRNVRNEDGEVLCSSLDKLSNLYELWVSAAARDEIIDLNHPLSSGPRFLKRLVLWGRLEKMPQWVTSLRALTKVDMNWSGLDENPLESFQHLPNLLHLYLNQVYNGEGLCFKAGTFLKLKTLSLRRGSGMKWLTVEEGTLPNLKELYLSELLLLEELPSGLQCLRNLKFVRLNDMSNKFIAKLLKQDEENEERRKIAHVPQVMIAFWKDDKWLCRYL